MKKIVVSLHSREQTLTTLYKQELLNSHLLELSCLISLSLLPILMCLSIKSIQDLRFLPLNLSPNSSCSLWLNAFRHTD